MGGLATKSAVARCALAAVLTTTACGSKDDVSAETTPIHLSIAGHIEDQKSYTDCSFYRSKRAQLLQFAQALSAYPVSFNLQASYEWFVGALNCEDDKTRQSTGGLNIIDYLADEFGFEIDIHQEGASLDHTSSGNNFADIRFIGGQVTSRISDTTGFQWDNPDHYASFQEGETGILHPEFTWQPSILAGGASVDHADGDHSRDMDSIGVWVPSGFGQERFHQHDSSDSARMVYVGSGPNQFVADWSDMGGCHFTDTADFVSVVSHYIGDGRLASGRMYTTTLVVPQPILFDEARRADLLGIIEKLVPLAEEGKVRFVTLRQTVDVWRDEYGAEPNVVRYDTFDAADRTCE